MKIILRYLKGTMKMTVLLDPVVTTLLGHADSDWSDGSNLISITINIYQIGGTSILWKISKQNFIYLSSTEAKYFSLS